MVSRMQPGSKWSLWLQKAFSLKTANKLYTADGACINCRAVKSQSDRCDSPRVLELDGWAWITLLSEGNDAIFGIFKLVWISDSSLRKYGKQHFLVLYQTLSVHVICYSRKGCIVFTALWYYSVFGYHVSLSLHPWLVTRAHCLPWELQIIWQKAWASVVSLKTDFLSFGYLFSEIRQAQKDKYCTISGLDGIQKLTSVKYIRRVITRGLERTKGYARRVDQHTQVRKETYNVLFCCFIDYG